MIQQNLLVFGTGGFWHSGEMSVCRDCGCDWLPCARQGECVSTWAFRWWMVRHPLEYRRERARVRAEVSELLGG